MIELLALAAMQSTTVPTGRLVNRLPKSTRARAVFPTVVVPLTGPDGKAYCIGVLVVGTNPAVEIYDASGHLRESQPLTVAVALSILQARAFEPLWTPLLNYAGDDLVRLRDLHLMTAKAVFEERAKAAPEQAREYALHRKTRARLHYGDALLAAGRHDEGFFVLEQGVSPALDYDKSGFNATILRTRTALRKAGGGDASGALASLDATLKESWLSPQYRVNVLINRAAVAAESGRHQEALRALDEAGATFVAVGVGKRASDDVMTTAGADFDWIRACSLYKLGGTTRPGASISNAGASTAQQVRGALCSGASDMVADVLAARLVDLVPIDPLLLSLQPALRHDAVNRQETLKAAAARPDVAIAFSRRMRVLPLVFEPALNGWRDR